MPFTKLQGLQQTRLTEIGEYLYQLRQEKGISLEQVEQATKVQKYQLEEIEPE